MSAVEIGQLLDVLSGHWLTAETLHVAILTLQEFTGFPCGESGP